MVCDTDRHRLPADLAGVGAGGGATAATALMIAAAFLRPAGIFATDAARVVMSDDGWWTAGEKVELEVNDAALILIVKAMSLVTMWHGTVGLAWSIDDGNPIRSRVGRSRAGTGHRGLLVSSIVAGVLWRACFSNARKLGVPCSGCGRMRCFSPRYIGQVPVVSDAAAYYYICEQKPCGALLVAHHMVLICPVHI